MAALSPLCAMLALAASPSAAGQPEVAQPFLQLASEVLDREVDARTWAEVSASGGSSTTPAAAEHPSIAAEDRHSTSPASPPRAAGETPPDDGAAVDSPLPPTPQPVPEPTPAPTPAQSLTQAPAESTPPPPAEQAPPPESPPATPQPVALPSLPAPDIDVTEGQLLSLQPQPTGDPVITPTTAIPYAVGKSCYYWAIKYHPVEGRLDLSEELRLPGPARTWDGAEASEINAQRSVAITPRSFDAATGMATAGWCVARNDPVGSYRYIIRQGDREVARFDFTVGDLL